MKTITTGTYEHTHNVVDQTIGTNIVMSLLENGNLHIGLTEAGRVELEELKHSDHVKFLKSYVDEQIFSELLSDEFLGNGWSFTYSLDTWGHLSDAPALADDLTVEDDGTYTGERIWFLNDYALYPTLLDRLVANDLIFSWWGKYTSDVPTMPETMHLW